MTKAQSKSNAILNIIAKVSASTRKKTNSNLDEIKIIKKVFTKKDIPLIRKIIENTTCNRDLKKATVTKYMNIMLNGYWVHENNILRLTKCCQAIDMRHRLEAVLGVFEIKPDFEFPCVVMLNCTLESMETIDLGRPRKWFESCKIAGIPCTPKQGSIVGLISKIKDAGLNSSRGKNEVQPWELKRNLFEYERELALIESIIKANKKAINEIHLVYGAAAVTIALKVNKKQALKFIRDEMKKDSPLDCALGVCRIKDENGKFAQGRDERSQEVYRQFVRILGKYGFSETVFHV